MMPVARPIRPIGPRSNCSDKETNMLPQRFCARGRAHSKTWRSSQRLLHSRSVLHCGSPLPLSSASVTKPQTKFGPSPIPRPRSKRQRTGAVQVLAEFPSGLALRCPPSFSAVVLLSFYREVVGLDSVCPMARVTLFWMQKERRTMNRQQMEMNFERSPGFKPVPRGHRRPTRARWWFAQMRQVVDHAWDSVPTPSVGRE